MEPPIFTILSTTLAISLIGAWFGISVSSIKKSPQVCERCSANALAEIGRETLDVDTVEQHGGGMGGGGDIRLRMKEEVTYRCKNCGKTTKQVVMKTN